jgi:hypothetical protein
MERGNANHPGERALRRTRTIFAGGAGATFAAVAVLMMLTPAALGGPSTAVTLSAPYKKATVILSSPSSSAGCGSYVAVKAPFFNKTSGIGGFSGNASTSWCTTSTNNSAISEGKFQVNLPISVSSTGTHTVTALWDTVARGSENLTAGTCTGSSSTLYSGCNRWAKTFVYGYAFLLDKTSHKKIASTKWPGNFAYSSNYTSCRYTACASSGSGGSSGSFGGSFYWAWYWNSTAMNSTHKYVLQMFILGGSSVELMTSGATLSGASANSQLNSATLGNDEQLVSVTIS